MAGSRDNDVNNPMSTSGSCDNDDNIDDVNVRLLALPTPNEQRAIIEALEAAEGVNESLYVYTVSRSWYDRWRLYVGLSQSSTSPALTEVPVCSAAAGSRLSSAAEHVTSSSTRNVESGSVSSVRTVPTSPGESRRSDRTRMASGSVGSSVAASTGDTTLPRPDIPGPLEMDLSNEDDNMSVDEKVKFYCLRYN